MRKNKGFCHFCLVFFSLLCHRKWTKSLQILRSGVNANGKNTWSTNIWNNDNLVQVRHKAILTLLNNILSLFCWQTLRQTHSSSFLCPLKMHSSVNSFKSYIFICTHTLFFTIYIFLNLLRHSCIYSSKIINSQKKRQAYFISKCKWKKNVRKEKIIWIKHKRWKEKICRISFIWMILNKNCIFT